MSLALRGQCGSELARDSGLTFSINVDCHGLIASKLAPTGVMPTLSSVLGPDIQWLSCSSPHTPASCRYPV
ncbi:hypothetical protein FPT12_15455 [Pseudomonas sp. H3(2019)]|nr:hypothetical protein FPT12_15455 [Pseudomonas sp. H3(2019)]